MNKFTKIFKRIILESIEGNTIIEKRVITSDIAKFCIFKKIDNEYIKVNNFKLILIYKGDRFDEVFIHNYKCISADVNVNDELYANTEENQEYIKLLDFLNDHVYSVNDFDATYKTVISDETVNTDILKLFADCLENKFNAEVRILSNNSLRYFTDNAKDESNNDIISTGIITVNVIENSLNVDYDIKYAVYDSDKAAENKNNILVELKDIDNEVESLLNKIVNFDTDLRMYFCL